MFKNNPLLAQLKQDIQEKLEKKTGTIKANSRGFGFLELENKKSNFFIPPPYMRKVLHGDKVEAVIRSENGKENAEPVALVEPALERFVGRVKFIRNRMTVVPDSPQIKDAINAKAIAELNSIEFKAGDWVVARLTSHPLKGERSFFCEIVKKVANSGDKIVPWWVTLAKNNLPNTEPVAPASWELEKLELERRDLTALPFITIDGESTKDMDDALYTTVNADGTISLTVAIADPTSYIESDSVLNKQAQARGFTIYLPGRNIPMLPRDLADNICSLIAGEERAVICCEINVSSTGVLNNYNFFAANIKSRAQLAYENVSDYMENKAELNIADPEIKEQLAALHQFTLARIDWRAKNAVAFPDRPDYEFELNKHNDVVAIHVKQRRIANRMVEESMILANHCCGKELHAKYNNGIFNTHAGFNVEKEAELQELFTAENVPFTATEVMNIEGFCKLRRWLNEQPTQYLDQRMRKMQAYSEVSVTPAPHYALGLDFYATWTSPIRKYGDMVNHRLLKAIIAKQDSPELAEQTIGDELMLQKRMNRSAERTISDWLYAMLLADDVAAKTEFSAEIFDINRAGMRVRLVENGAAAFIPGSLILKDKERLVCSQELGRVLIDNKVVYQLADNIKVNLAEVRLDTRSLIAQPVATQAEES